MYRILSPTAILGYGFPKQSFDKAMQLEIDLIGVDAGSMDAGPYYLGSGAHYCAETAVRRDMKLIIEGSVQQDCPVVIGSAGFAGSSPQIHDFVGIVKEILDSLQVHWKIAVICSDIEPSMLLDHMEILRPLGDMPPLEDDILLQSKIVAQMGIEPIITALDAGARIVICGRCYDPAVFAADPIRKGYPRGLAYHAAKILECGAIACEPGSGSDCMIAELTDEHRALFYPANPDRAATIHSIAAHTLYEKSAPDIFPLPGGILDIRKTVFFQDDPIKAGFYGSEFIPDIYSLKIEGCLPVGKRVVSLVPLKQPIKTISGLRIYGNNGVEIFEDDSDLPEAGIIVLVTSDKQEKARDALAYIRSTLLHYGYKHRLSTAGNLAFPLSPSDLPLKKQKGYYQYMLIAGTRDPIFQREWPDIQKETISALCSEHPELSNCRVDFIVADRENPTALLESVAPELQIAIENDRVSRETLMPYRETQKKAFEGINTGTVYQWSLHHLTVDEQLISQLFEIRIETPVNGGWKTAGTLKPGYHFNRTTESSAINLPGTDSYSREKTVEAASGKAVPLTTIARVIRSKNSGINLITFDIIFNSEHWYRKAKASRVFGNGALAELFKVESSAVDVYHFQPALAIKFTIHRPQLSGGPGDKDVFGAQQHGRLLNLCI